MKLGQLVDIVMGNIFRKSWERMLGLGASSRPYSIYHPKNQFFNNQVLKFLVFHYFEGVESAN